MNVFLYARVSTPEQAKKDLSIPDQLRQLHEYCQQNNHTIVKEYQEPGVTATDDKRPAFQEMIAAAVSKQYNATAILVLTTSRFFRDALKAKVYKRKLKRYGIKVIAIKQETTDDPMGNFMEGMFELIDQYESEINAFHTLRGMKENARKGYLNGANAPYGYTRVKVQDERGNEKAKLEINASEAETVRTIFKLYYNGDKDHYVFGAKNVAMILNEKGFRTRQGQEWNKQYILNILRNPTYTGTYYFNVRDVKAGKRKPQVPPIIGKNMFATVQEIIEKRNPKKMNPAIIASPTLLLGLLKCGKCGASMTRETGKNNQYSYYNCRRYIRQGKTSCEGQRIPRKLIERQILEHLSNKIFSVERTKIMLEDIYKSYKEARQRNNEKLYQFNEQIKDIQRRLNNHYKAIEAGVIDFEDVQERIRELKKQKAGAEATIEDLRSKFKIPLYYFTARHIRNFQTQLKKIFISPDSALAKKYLNALVEKITVNGNYVHIDGKIHGALQIMTHEKEKAVETTHSEVPTAVVSKLPGEDSNLGQAGYT